MKLHSSMLGTFFTYTLTLSMLIFKKIFADISGRKFRTLYCSNVTANESLELSPRNICEDFFLKIGILRAKDQGVYKKRPQHRTM